MVAGVGKICKIMKIGKTLENGLGVVRGAPDRRGRGGELMSNRSVAKTKTTKHKQTFRTSAGGGGV